MDGSKVPQVKIPADGSFIEGNLLIPPNAKGLVLFSHGSGSSRFSPRNMLVARLLRKEGLATLLVDLLTENEDQDYERRFDIELLSKRLDLIIKWIKNNPEINQLALGLFGASTGAASALICAADNPKQVAAVVSRGGRPDLALDYLPRVSVPVMLIVGANDLEVLELNKNSYSKLKCEKKLEIIPGATHLFEEKGALEKAASYAANWLYKYLILSRDKYMTKQRHSHGLRGRVEHIDPLEEFESKLGSELPVKNHLLSDKPTKPLKRARSLDERYLPLHGSRKKGII